jgi:hypothetical protein
LVASVFLSGCGGGSESTTSKADQEAARAASDAEWAAEKAVKEHMKDPESATFRNERALGHSSGDMIVCGEVNGRNGFGGKAGYQRFVWADHPVFPHGRSLVFEESARGSTRTALELTLTMCGADTGG